MNLRTLVAVAGIIVTSSATEAQDAGPPPLATTDTYALSYDIIYDQKDNSLSNVACSNGLYGLLTQGFKTFGDLPSYPFVGGAPQIQSWNSFSCGTCWQLTFTDVNGVPASLSFTAINTPPQPQGGFSISLEGMNRLTSDNALTLDGVSISASQLPASGCGLSEVNRV